MKSSLFLILYFLLMMFTARTDATAQRVIISKPLLMEQIKQDTIPAPAFINIMSLKDLEWNIIHDFYLKVYEESDFNYPNKKMGLIARLFLFDTANKKDFTTEHANYYLKEIESLSYPPLKTIALLTESGKLNLNDPETLNLIRNSVEKWRKHSESSDYSNQVYLEGVKLLKDYLILNQEQRDY